MKLPLPFYLTLLILALALDSCTNMAGKDSGYALALTDLRNARWNLKHHSGNIAVDVQEDKAVAEIDHAITAVTKLTTEDENKVYPHPAEDPNLNGIALIHHAIELLKKAREDINSEEDMPGSHDIRLQVLNHIDAAIEATKGAIHAAKRR